MSNYGSSTLSGAATGATVGSTFGPVGAAIGGGIGALAGLFGAYADNKSDEKAKKAYNDKLAEAARQYGVSVDELGKMVKDYYDQKGGLLDEQGKKEYRKALTDTDWEALGAVDFDKDSYKQEDYYDQNRKQLVQAAENDALGAANVSGSVLGSGAVGNMLSAAVSTEKGLADSAFQRMQADRNFDYSLAKDSASQRLQAVKDKIATLGTAYGQDEQDERDYLETLLGLNDKKAQAHMTAFMSQQL